MALTDIPANVARGVALLDKRGPSNWRDRIDLATFNIESSQECVLGQVFGSYWTALSILALPLDQSADYGFTPHRNESAVPPAESAVNWAALQNEWENVLSRELVSS